MQSSELNSNPLDSPGALPAPEAEQKEQATASPSDHQPLVFVVGGTGKQGSAVCRALAAQARWRVRTLSRDPGSQAARALRTLGVEVLQGDFERTDALKTAMSGAYGVFGNLDYWTLGEEKELAIGRLLVELAAELDVKHFVYSSLEHIHRDSGGKLSVPFFDNKARIAEYAVSKGLPCTFVKYSSYYENFLMGYTRLQRDAEGRYVFRFPLGDKRMALVPLQGAGRVVAEVFAHPEQSMGKSIGLAGAHLTGAEMAATFERVVGRPAVFVDIPLEEFAKSNPRASTDMWVYKREFEPTFARYLADSRAFVPEIEGLDHWLRDWPLDDGITQ